MANENTRPLSTQDEAELRMKHSRRTRAKLSDRQDQLLRNQGKHTTAYYLIKRLHKINNSKTQASDFRTLEVKDGKVRFADENGRADWIDVANDRNASINYTICGAVLKGIITTSTLGYLPSLTLGVDTQVPDAAPTPEPEPAYTPAPVKRSDMLQLFWDMRDYCNDGSDMPDDISTGLIAKARKMQVAGIPNEAILHAATINWPAGPREKFNITDYDPTTFVKADFDHSKAKVSDKVDVGYHKLSDYVASLCKLRTPVYLCGPTQSGKTTLAEDVATILGMEYGTAPMDFGKVPLTGGASPSWLLGRDTRDGFKVSRFVELFRSGGVFLFDEMDSADPNMLVVLNDALANGHLDHPYIGMVEKHPDFIPMAAGNTWGTGPTRKYPGRTRLDGATLERFRPGRVWVDYDRDLERLIWEAYNG